MTDSYRQFIRSLFSTVTKLIKSPPELVGSLTHMYGTLLENPNNAVSGLENRFCFSQEGYLETLHYMEKPYSEVLDAKGFLNGGTVGNAVLGSPTGEHYTVFTNMPTGITKMVTGLSDDSLEFFEGLDFWYVGSSILFMTDKQELPFSKKLDATGKFSVSLFYYVEDKTVDEDLSFITGVTTHRAAMQAAWELIVNGNTEASLNKTMDLCYNAGVAPNDGVVKRVWTECGYTVIDFGDYLCYGPASLECLVSPGAAVQKGEHLFSVTQVYSADSVPPYNVLPGIVLQNINGAPALLQNQDMPVVTIAGKPAITVDFLSGPTYAEALTAFLEKAPDSPMVLPDTSRVSVNPVARMMSQVWGEALVIVHIPVNSSLDQETCAQLITVLQKTAMAGTVIYPVFTDSTGTDLVLRTADDSDAMLIGYSNGSLLTKTIKDAEVPIGLTVTDGSGYIS